MAAEIIEKLNNSPLAKGGLVVLVVVAVGAAVFMGMHMDDGSKSRDISASQQISDSQKQIEAIKKMDIPESQKQTMLAHEEGELKQAQSGTAPAH